MNKKIIGLLALSVVVFSLYAGNNSEACGDKKVVFRNNLAGQVLFRVKSGGAPSNADLKISQYVVSADENKELPFCENGNYIQDIIGFNSEDAGSKGHPMHVVSVGRDKPYVNVEVKLDTQKKLTTFKNDANAKTLTVTINSLDKDPVVEIK